MYKVFNIIGVILLVFAIITVFKTELLDLGIISFIVGSALVQIQDNRTMKKQS